MLHHVLILASEPATHGGSGFGLNLGTLLSGIAALLLAIGSGLGSFLRYRKAAKRIKIAADHESTRFVQEAADRLTEQYEARLSQNAETVDRLNHASDEQRHLYEERLANQQTLINTLLSQILKHRK